MGSALGTIAGGVGGFLLGGPAGAALGASLGGALDASSAADQQASAASGAAATSAAAANQATQLQREMWLAQQAQQKPWLQAGTNALAELQTASKYTPFGMQQFQADPGYGFRVAEGQKALDRQAAARGGLISGGALKAAQRFGQEMGSQEYQNAFNRYQTERQAKLGPLQSLAGVGQTAANTLGTAGQQYASNVGNIGMGSAADQGNAMLAAANARSSAYQGIGQNIGGALGTPLVQNYLTGLYNKL